MSSIYAEFRGKTKAPKKAKEFIQLLILSRSEENLAETKARAEAAGMTSPYLFEENTRWNLCHSKLKTNGEITLSFDCATSIDGEFFECQMHDFARLTGSTALARVCNSQTGEAQFLSFHDEAIKWHEDQRDSMLDGELALILEDKETRGIADTLECCGAQIVDSINDKPTLIFHGKKTAEAAAQAATEVNAQLVNARDLDEYLEGWHLYISRP